MLGLFANDDHKLQKYVPKRPSPKKESYFEGIRAELGKHEFLMPLKDTEFENHPKTHTSFSCKNLASIVTWILLFE